jgi:hypothetical protein
MQHAWGGGVISVLQCVCVCCTTVQEVTHHRKSARGGQACWNVVICEFSTYKRSRYHGSLKSLANLWLQAPPPWCKWDLHSSGTSCSVVCYGRFGATVLRRVKCQKSADLEVSLVLRTPLPKLSQLATLFGEIRGKHLKSEYLLQKNSIKTFVKSL